MNRIDKLFNEKNGNILSVYFTAGYPQADSTRGIVKALAESGADMVEIGIPFSDPMADGPVIQHSNEIALQNGMSLKLLFSQLLDIRKEVEIPVLLMGYLNPVMQFGVENFCKYCMDVGIDGVILPDMPSQVFLEEYKEIFEKYNLYNILLISPQSDNERILEIDKISQGFIYMVSSSAITGVRGKFSDEQKVYFNRIKNMNLRNPALIGFGISDHDTYLSACKHAKGAIIGSAFVKMLGQGGNISNRVEEFVKEIKG